MNSTQIELLELCKKWREKYKPSCAESVYQVDEINLALPELAEEIFELIGWYKS